METSFEVHTNYQMGGHATLDGHDIRFYWSIPNYRETYLEEKRGQSRWVPAVPRPDMVSLLSVTGSAVLSSTVLAAAIKAWLQSRRTKITITATRSKTQSKTQVTYEGPHLNDSVSEIQAVLEAIGGKVLDVRAEQLDGTALTASEWRRLHNP